MDLNYKDLLKESLFYYCAGKDPSPIIAFKTNYPLYVYVDKKDYSNELYKRLNDHNFKLLEKQEILPKTTLSIWKYNEHTFYLIYAQNDASKAFIEIYDDIIPKCICNYRYELSNRSLLQRAEKETTYILGHCFDDNFMVIDEIQYYGDYSFNKDVKIKLYKEKIELTFNR